ncbi:PREDICTED: heavy metal-associated isoprenylated plant protein 26-like [Populus euphratica]|uniref:Heavy metal-associated isoprenylated plant protein 26-like n=1 Tax=Populus euphratica TaxID=75702 RepID=A0AAJ6X422_POPEU|nr:PREDICTED: heavy metal-associated isoprenylated plant protein 26-like [Populus euphratica]
MAIIWFSGLKKPSSFSVHRLVLGTHTSGNFPYHPMIAGVVPSTAVDEDGNKSSSANSVIAEARCDDQTVEVKVRIDCEGCERKVRRALEGMKGVKQVVVERKANKVTVVGYVEPSKVVARVAHRTGKKAELWPYVPYDTVAHPYAPGVYDKKAPAGYVRNAEDPQVSQLARASSFEVRYTTAFSDENPAACVIM